jgi:hypothetical protein
VREKVKVSIAFHNKMTELLQHLISSKPEKGGIQQFLIGADEKGVVRYAERLKTGNGCPIWLAVSLTEMGRATTKVYKAGFTPIGVARVLGCVDYRKNGWNEHREQHDVIPGVLYSLLTSSLGKDMVILSYVGVTGVNAVLASKGCGKDIVYQLVNSTQEEETDGK